MIKTCLAALLGATVAATSAPALGQTATDVAPVTVTGSRGVPVELQAKADLCEMLLRDTYLRGLFEAGGMPFIYAATRFPRNPDYTAPPKTEPGSAIPAVKSNRERALGGTDSASHNNSDDGSAQSEAASLAASDDDVSRSELVAALGSGLESAINNCRGPGGASRYPGGGTGRNAKTWSSFEGRFTRRDTAGSSRWAGNPASGIESLGRGRIKMWDKSLPLAFALFDDGRYEEALGQFKIAHSKLSDVDGGDEAALMIGKIYLLGLKEKSDPAHAVDWLKKAAQARFNPWLDLPVFDPLEPDRNTAIGEACVVLANIYRQGRGPVAKDMRQAIEYLERAVWVGHVPAAKTLGDIYYYGLDVPKDMDKAYRNYREAARYGYGPAAAALAGMYDAGEVGGRPDRQKALAWYQVAAKLDEPGALYALAVAYDRGQGVAADSDLALGLYKRAALEGDPAAQTALGSYFYEGGPVARDLAAARQWFEKAAIAGDPDGMFNLAAMMARGEGGGVDRVKAWAWLKIAERQGHPKAAAAAHAIEADFTPQDRAGVTELVAKKAS